VTPFALSLGPEDGDWLESNQGDEIRLSVPAGRSTRGVDFRLGGGAPDLRVSATVDGVPLAPEALRLGGEGSPASSQPLRIASGAEELQAKSRRSVNFPYASAEPLLYLWESRVASAASAELTPQQQDSLRALGYVVD
jgi:hypothetical protein